ncbi:MAG: hypothetical protein FJW30_01845 [Acidobacteria bacterium]|nr:hypothetical protein [Acidobacteriota bacterium]
MKLRIKPCWDTIFPIEVEQWTKTELEVVAARVVNNRSCQPESKKQGSRGKQPWYSAGNAKVKQLS